MVPVDVEGSSDSEANSVAKDSIGAHLGSSMSKIFKAVQILSHQGRIDAADERK